MKLYLRNRKKMILCGLLLLLLVIAAVVLTVWNPFAKKENSTKKLQTTMLTKMDLTTSISATGTIQSKTSRSVTSSQNSGTVKSIAVAVGDTVKKGDTLLTFTSEDAEESLADAKDSLSDTNESASSELSSAQKKVTEAQETYETEKTKLAKQVSQLKQNLTKLKKQISTLKSQIKKEQDAAARQQLTTKQKELEESYEKAQSEYTQALENQETTNKQNKQQITSAKEALTQTKSSTKKSKKEAQKQVLSAEKTLDACTVTAPCDATVTSISVAEGDTYTGGTLLTLDDTSNLMVSTTVSESDINDISIGQRVVILTDATGDEEIEGSIVSISKSKASTSSGNTMSDTSSDSDGYPVEISITDSNDKLWLGMTAKCSIILTEEKDTYAVPYDAIHTDKDQSCYIEVLDSTGTVSSDAAKQNESTKKITVTKGLESDYYVGISGEGLSEGLQVVLPTDETSSDTDTDKKESKDSAFPSDFKQDSMKSAPDQGGPGGGAPGGMGGDRGGN